MKRFVKMGATGAALALVAACEKPTPFENTTPSSKPPSSLPVPSLDASLPPLDASAQNPGDGSLPPETPVGTFTQPALLKAIADCSREKLRGFAERATALRDAARTLTDAASADTLAATQQAWRGAMGAWQELELFRFGPAGSSAEPGGRDLRNKLYFYPDLQNCQVDLALVSRAYEMGAQPLSVSARGLGALEYLLFYGGDANSCSPALTINTVPTGGTQTPWQAITADELAKRRAAYALVVAEDVLAQANALVSAWEPGQGGFYEQFTTAGAGSTLFARAFDAFNYVDNAMFYIDTELKDYKLAIPAGVSLECGQDACPEQAESRFSGNSVANIRGNLAGFRLLFNGCGTNYSGFGFDDWLRASGVPELADRMTQAAIAADTVAAGLTQPIDVLVTTNVQQVRELHAAVKTLTDLFKADFLSALNLQRPSSAEGDND